MKKQLKTIFSIVLCSLLLGGGAFAQSGELGSNPKVRLLSAQQSMSKVQFQMDNLQFTEVQTNNGVAQVPTFTEGVNVSEKGMPILPILTRSLAVSETHKMKVEVVSSKFIEKKNVLIAPSKGIITRDQDPNKIPYVYGAGYQENRFFPGEIATLGTPFILRDVRGQSVNFAPLQYNPVTKTLRIYTEITVAVSETPQMGENAISTVKSKTFNGFEDFYKRSLMNYTATRYTPVEEKTNGRMIVIVPEKYKDQMNDFVAWKNQRGLPTELKVSEDIAAPITYEKLKAYIKSEYEKPSNDLMYVLIVGDHQDIPAMNIATSYPAYKSDQAYGQLAGSDHMNEVFIGRFSCESAADLQTQIDRTIHYERDIKAGEAFLGRALAIASAQGQGSPYADNGESDIQHNNVIAKLLTDYGYTNITKSYDPGVTATNIVDAFNAGISVANYTGHGADTYWVTSHFGLTHMKNLKNYNQLPFIFDVACVNGNFTGQTCFAEGLLRSQKENKPTGAIAIIASTINQSWGAPMRGQDEMNNILCEKYANDENPNIKRTFGGITTNGMFAMIEKYVAGNDGNQMADTWTIFGDPSLLVRTLTPQKMQVTSADIISPDAQSFDVSCDFDGALATLSANNKIFGSSLVKNGKATIEVNGITDESTVTLTVIGYNKETVVKQISTNGTPNPYAPITDLEAKKDNNDVVLNWHAPGYAPIPGETVLTENFETGELPSGWSNIDADGDSYNWDPTFLFGKSFGHQGSKGMISSSSYMNSVGEGSGPTQLKPDNYLITPELDLTNGGTLIFWVCAQDVDYVAEHYAVYASTTGNAVEDFKTPLLEETLQRKDANSTATRGGDRVQSKWRQKIVTLPEGTKYVAFRHFQSTGLYWINLDDIEIKANTKAMGRGQAAQRELILLSVTESPELLRSGEAEIILEAHDVWSDGSGYQFLLDADHNEYGQTIPEQGFQLYPDCNVPANFYDPFEYKIPVNADPSCTPEHLVVDGKESIKIPAGTYDYAIAQPQAGKSIWIAAQGPSKKDDYVFEAGKRYHFLMKLMVYGDGAELTIFEPTDFTYTIYRDGTKIKEGLSETTYKDLDMAGSDHEYCVEVQYAEGVSPKTCVTYTASSIEDVTAAKPYSLAVVGKTITVTSNGSAMIYDMNGRRMAAGAQVVSYTAQSGFYAVRIDVNGKTYVEKITVK